jgi:hypothetical protein
VRLAAARLAEEVDDLVAVDEVELGQGQDAVLVERGLEGEVEAGQRLDGEQTRPIFSAALTRRPSRKLSSSPSRASIASRAETSPRSS